MMKRLATLACLLGCPAAVYGQAVLAGAVSDASGAPLPGVAVAATSDALIENVRTAVTDTAGRYRIEDLRPGRYQVRFWLTGWRAYERMGVELTASSDEWGGRPDKPLDEDYPVRPGAGLFTEILLVMLAQDAPRTRVVGIGQDLLDYDEEREMAKLREVVADAR